MAVCAKDAVIDAWEDKVRCTKRGAVGYGYIDPIKSNLHNQTRTEKTHGERKPFLDVLRPKHQHILPALQRHQHLPHRVMFVYVLLIINIIHQQNK